jgi:hypothetical protein
LHTISVTFVLVGDLDWRVPCGRTREEGKREPWRPQRLDALRSSWRR